MGIGIKRVGTMGVSIVGIGIRRVGTIKISTRRVSLLEIDIWSTKIMVIGTTRIGTTNINQYFETISQSSSIYIIYTVYYTGIINIANQWQQLLHGFILKSYFFKGFYIVNAIKKIALNASKFFQRNDWVSKLNSRLSIYYRVAATKKCLELYLQSYRQKAEV